VGAVQPLATTNGDWCSGLDYPSSGTSAPGGTIAEVILWHPAATLSSGNLWLKTDASTGQKTYVENLVFSTPATTHFSLACIQGEGVTTTCQQFEADLTAFYKTTPAMAQGITGIQCSDSSDGGCDCSYTFTVALADEGSWAADGQGLISMNSEPPNYTYNGAFIPEYEPPVPVTATYCNSGGTLTLTGSGGSSLAGILGLRTLTMGAQQPPAQSATPADGGM
jgi:hypothetical protein